MQPINALLSNYLVVTLFQSPQSIWMPRISPCQNTCMHLMEQGQLDLSVGNRKSAFTEVQWNTPEVFTILVTGFSLIHILALNLKRFHQFFLQTCWTCQQ